MRRNTGSVVVAFCGAAAGLLGLAVQTRADFIGVWWEGAQVYQIDAQSGQLTQIGQFDEPNRHLNSLATGRDGWYYTGLRRGLSGPNSLARFRLDPRGGIVKEVLGETDLNDVRSMASLLDGTFLVSAATGAQGQNAGLYRLDPDTLTSTLVRLTSILHQSLMQTQAGDVYTWTDGDGLVRVNPATGEFIDVSASHGNEGLFPQSLCEAPDGGFYAADQSRMWRVDPLTGQATFLYSFFPADFPDIRGIEVIPAPATGMMLGLACAAATARRRR